ncbi:hypothetical protein ACA910_018568 [Epithemia clementina (nom. ined.)]
MLLTTIPVMATCNVQDHTGEPVLLHDPSVLPKSITYNPSNDRLECFPNGCRSWTINNCLSVYCVGSKSCEDAILAEIGIGGLNCRGAAACQGVELTAIPTIVCVGDPHVTNVCHGARLEATTQIICVGPHACGSPDTLTQGPTDVYLLRDETVVRCGGGKGKTTVCQNLIIHITHGRRACFTVPAEQLTPEEREEQKHCAVICDNRETDCDPDTIHFQV